jgi:hypothetical protein
VDRSNIPLFPYPKVKDAHVSQRQLIFSEGALTIVGVDLLYGWNFCDRGERVLYLPREEWQVAEHDAYQCVISLSFSNAGMLRAAPGG